VGRVTTDSLSRDEARRLALAAQGFDRPRPSDRVGPSHLRRVIRRLGLLQIDSVNVLVRAHYLVPYSRLGPYDPAVLDRLVYERREFTEQWAREASILPVDRWPLFRHRMDGYDRRMRALRAFMARRPAYAGRVIAEVRARGPVEAGHVREPDGSRGRTTGWWGWTDAKAVLEGHFAAGRLAIARRSPTFARQYDLAERVIPAGPLSEAPPPVDAAQRELVRLAAGALGVATADDLADYYRLPIRDARDRIAELVSAGELRAVRVEGWRPPAFLPSSVSIPDRIDARAILSPFDPLIWFRPRTLRLFGLDYRIEIYVPRPKRRWGYYVLPFLLGDRIAARVDLKADRAASRLLVEAAHLEPGADRDETARALAAELRSIAAWLSLDRVVVGRRGALARALADAVRRGLPPT
jgi:uncharacterized protein YcaQ